MFVQKHPAISGFYYTVKPFEDAPDAAVVSPVYQTEGLCHQAISGLLDGLRCSGAQS